MRCSFSCFFLVIVVGELLSVPDEVAVDLGVLHSRVFVVRSFRGPRFAEIVLEVFHSVSALNLLGFRRCCDLRVGIWEL